MLWDNRLQNDIGNTCLASVDGADFRMLGEKLMNGKPDPRCCSCKLKAPGLRCLIALSVRTSGIVFLAGPFLPGVLNDLSIFRESGIKDMMEQYEKVEADDGCMGECPGCCMCPGWFDANEDQAKLRGRVRMRHEIVNKRMKNFGCLLSRFRHDATKHSACFRAVAVLTQLSMESGEPLIDVREYDDRLTDAQILQIFGV